MKEVVNLHITECNGIFSEAFPFWDALEDEDQSLLCRFSRTVSYRKGETVHDGNECTGAFIVKRGSLRIYMLSENGKEITLYRVFAGEVCILSASCALRAITFDVIIDAEEDTECILVNGSVFAAVCERCSDMKIYTLETALSRFSDVMWVMQQILFMSLDKRLAIFLWEEISKSGNLTVKLTQEQIAKYMGSAREAVSRMLKYFATEGIAEVSRGGIKILDREKLRALTR